MHPFGVEKSMFLVCVPLLHAPQLLYVKEVHVCVVPVSAVDNITYASAGETAFASLWINS